jgi:hypothetical protein
MKVVGEIVQEEYYDIVKGIRGHVGSMRAKQTRLICHPAFYQNNRLSKELALTDFAGDSLHEIKGAKASKLFNRYVDQCSTDVEFYDFMAFFLHLSCFFQHWTTYVVANIR